jgi:hypothetical protein
MSCGLEIAVTGAEVRWARSRKMGITLVPVLVPVCTGIWCDLMQHSIAAKTLMNTGDLRVSAAPCETLQKGKKRTQNLPIARSWGFAPPPGTSFKLF